ncbi:hypothetical protein ACP70R_023354 [Stipagrostis hirtigluma subsp. patula]
MDESAELGAPASMGAFSMDESAKLNAPASSSALVAPASASTFVTPASSNEASMDESAELVAPASVGPLAMDESAELGAPASMGAFSMDESAKLDAPASVDMLSTDKSAELVAPASLDVLVVPDSDGEEDSVCLCKRCGALHGVKDIEECRRVRREQSRCKRCGLIHSDYLYMVWIREGFVNFDCELYIPNVDELEMSGGAIILPEHVAKRVDELSPRMQRKRKQDGREVPLPP